MNREERNHYDKTREAIIQAISIHDQTLRESHDKTMKSVFDMAKANEKSIVELQAYNHRQFEELRGHTLIGFFKNLFKAKNGKAKV